MGVLFCLIYVHLICFVDSIFDYFIIFLKFSICFVILTRVSRLVLYLFISCWMRKSSILVSFYKKDNRLWGFRTLRVMETHFQWEISETVMKRKRQITKHESQRFTRKERNSLQETPINFWKVSIREIKTAKNVMEKVEQKQGKESLKEVRRHLWSSQKWSYASVE